MSQTGGLAESDSTPVGPGRFPITPYVVGPIGQAGYQTIQSAINAAHAASGGFIFIQNGTYTENLTLYPNISLSGPQILSGYPGSPSACVIVGNHIPPTTGSMTFNNITFITTVGDTFSSLAAGTSELNFTNAGCGVTDGYFLNIPNWAGILSFWDFNPSLGINDGGINNPTGGAQVFCYEAGVGTGTTRTMQISGFMIFNQGEIFCPVQFNSGSIFESENNIFGGTMTINGNAIVESNYCLHKTGNTPAVVMSSSANCSFYETVFDSTNNPCISGSGAGILTLGNVTFANNSSISGTITRNTGSALLVGEARIGHDAGGLSGCTSVTNTNSTTIGAGTGTVKMSSGNNANNAAWIKIYIGTTPYWIPAWTTNSP